MLIIIIIMMVMMVMMVMTVMMVVKPLGSQVVCPGSFFCCWVFAVVVFRGGSCSVKFHER